MIKNVYINTALIIFNQTYEMDRPTGFMLFLRKKFFPNSDDWIEMWTHIPPKLRDTLFRSPTKYGEETDLFCRELNMRWRVAEEPKNLKLIVQQQIEGVPFTPRPAVFKEVLF